MPSQRATPMPAAGANAKLQNRAGRSFFFGMSILLLVLVLVGFGPTFYLRPFFDVPPRPAYLYLHGLILTGWYVLLVVQTSLIRSARTATHRRLGIFGAFWALLVVVGGQIAALNMIGRVASSGVELDMAVEGISVIAALSGALWSSIESSLAFAILVVAAIALRRQPAVHKRLMLLASILSVSAAVLRIANWPILGGGGSASPIPFGPLAPVAMVLLVATLLAYDLMATRRLHAASLVGGGAVLLHQFGYPSSLIASSEFGMAFTRWLQ